jgi:hypothetical protein
MLGWPPLREHFGKVRPFQWDQSRIEGDTKNEAAEKRQDTVDLGESAAAHAKPLFDVASAPG